MPEINIIAPGITNGQIMIGFVLGLFIIIAIPLIGSWLLWFSAKLFKFKNQSFKVALKCVLISFGVTTVTNMILFAGNLAKNNYMHVLALVLTGLVVEFICVKKMFKVSYGKAIGVTLASFMIGIILFVIFLILLSLFLNWIMPELVFNQN